MGIANEWPMVKLGDIQRKVSSINPTKFPDQQFSLYSIPAYDAGVPEKILGSGIKSNKIELQPGDILLSKIVPHIRRSWIVGEHDTSSIGSSEWIVYQDDRLDPRYLQNFLLSDYFHAQFLQTVAGVGGSLNRARPAAVAQISIPIPPIAEQRRIAEILHTVVTAINDCEKQLASLSQIQANILTYTEQADHVPFSRLAKIRSGTVQPSEHPFCNLPHVAPDNIESGTGRLKNVNTASEDAVTSNKYEFYAGDLLYSKIRPYLNKFAIPLFNGICSADMYALIPTQPATAEYLAMIIRSRRFLAYAEQQSGRSSIPKINRKALTAFPVPFHSESEIQRVTKIYQAVESTRSKLQLKIDGLKELQNSLSTRAFAGKL